MVGESCNLEAELVIFTEASSRREERIRSMYTQEQQGAYPNFIYEAYHGACLRDQKKESPIIPLFSVNCPQTWLGFRTGFALKTPF
jgi:hypothetical protein